MRNQQWSAACYHSDTPHQTQRPNTPPHHHQATTIQGAKDLVRSAADRCFVPPPDCATKMSDAEGLALVGDDVTAAVQEVFVGYDGKQVTSNK